MEWFENLFVNIDSVAHIIVLYALVISLGLALGRLKLFGVPLGFLSAFVWNLPIAYVYFILSLEECVRLGISLIIFKKKIWMESLQ